MTFELMGKKAGTGLGWGGTGTCPTHDLVTCSQDYWSPSCSFSIPPGDRADEEGAHHTDFSCVWTLHGL